MKDDTFKPFVEDQLRDLSGVEIRRMFGGWGFYRAGVFFGILFSGRLYFKVGAATRSDYLKLGMKPFRPSEKQTLKSYYEVPADVVEDRERLVEWALAAVSAAKAAKR